MNMVGWVWSPLAPPRLGQATLIFPRGNLRGRSCPGLWTDTVCQGHLHHSQSGCSQPFLPGAAERWGWLPLAVCGVDLWNYIFSDLTTASVCCSFTALKMFSNNPQVFLSHTIAWLVTAQLNPYLRRLIKTLNRTSHKACSLPDSCQK